MSATTTSSAPSLPRRHAEPTPPTPRGSPAFARRAPPLGRVAHAGTPDLPADQPSRRRSYLLRAHRDRGEGLEPRHARCRGAAVHRRPCSSATVSGVLVPRSVVPTATILPTAMSRPCRSSLGPVGCRADLHRIHRPYTSLPPRRGPPAQAPVCIARLPARGGSLRGRRQHRPHPAPLLEAQLGGLRSRDGRRRRVVPRRRARRVV